MRGKLLSAGIGGFLRRDHPRRCGENVPTRPLRSAFSGSPPQVRGKRNSQYYRVRKPRITPAGAGKTVFGTDRRTAAEDHPRRCGENSAAKHLTSAGTGSPPQVRGKLTQSSMSILHTGITPAGAGKTCRLPVADTMGWDHPRRCGENLRMEAYQVGFAGSPPQVRGKRMG